MKYIDRNRIPTDRRPLGYWLTAIRRPLREQMREAFATVGVTRREWRLLATLRRGPATADDLRTALPPRRDAVHSSRRTLEQVLDGLVTRGWATLDRGSYTLTAEGERIHHTILGNVQRFRARVTAGVTDADYATTMSTLEKVAGNLGWDPAAHRAHRPGRRRGTR
jgi:DNA-binding MarR family transcriptional regulator